MTFPIHPKKFNWLLVACLLLGSQLYAQTATRTFDESYPAKTEVSLEHSHGPITILPSADGKVRLVTRISANGESEADAMEFVNKIEVDIRELSTSLEVKIGFIPVKSWTQKNRITRVVFKDGTRLKNITDFALETTLYLPTTERLALKTRFEDVRVDDQVSLQNLRLDLHNTSFRAGNLAGALEVEMRFGSLRLGNIEGAVSGSLHNATVEMGNAEAVTLDSRFSKIECANIASLKFDGHNDRLKIDGIAGSLEIKDRFGTYVIGKTSSGEINSHNGTFDIDSGTDYEIEGRFAKFDFEELNELELQENHNCEFDLQKLGSVKGDGRFTNLEIDALSLGADLDLYNGKLFVDELAPGFQGVEVSGSFFEVDLDFSAPTEYHILADLRFGKLDLPRDLTAKKNQRDHSQVQYEGKTANATADSPKIRVRGENGRLRVD